MLSNSRYISNIVYKFIFVHTHLTTGIVGEKLACTFFEQKGFVILHTNWRHGRCEVDIIASKNNVLHFIEVKTRSNKDFGLPEENPQLGSFAKEGWSEFPPESITPTSTP